MSVELTLLVAVVGMLLGLGLGLYVTKPKIHKPDAVPFEVDPVVDALNSWIEQQEALEGIYHGIKGCNDPDHGHPINLERNL